jgi:uncharacterized protein with NRDE domain
MCLIFIALKKHPVYKQIIAANRDEFYNRRTAAATYWHDHPEILGGRDLEAGGTWLAMNTNGKISMVTNFRDPKNIDPSAPSRGQLVTDYLLQNVTADAYIKSIQPQAKRYNGFNLIAGTIDDLHYFSNYGEGSIHLTEGLFGLSNHLLETPWPKVLRGKQKLTDIATDPHLTADKLFDVLFDDVVADDSLLPDTGIGLERERALSSMFIKSPGYGTRCSTVIMVDHENNVSFTERVYDLTTFDFTAQTFNFSVQ